MVVRAWARRNEQRVQWTRCPLSGFATDGEPRTCQRNRIAERSKGFYSIFLAHPTTDGAQAMPGHVFGPDFVHNTLMAMTDSSHGCPYILRVFTLPYRVGPELCDPSFY